MKTPRKNRAHGKATDLPKCAKPTILTKTGPIAIRLTILTDVQKFLLMILFQFINLRTKKQIICLKIK